MIFLIPLLFAFTLGFLIFCFIHQRSPLSDPLDTITAFWLGIGSCALLTFYTFVLLNHYSPYVVTGFAVVLIVVLCFLCRHRFAKMTSTYPNPKVLKAWLVVIILAVPAWLLMGQLSRSNLSGNWDAWTFWNYLPRYLWLAGANPQDLYFYENLPRHPWLMPMWTLFGWNLTGGFHLLTALNSRVFALIALATVFFGVLSLTDMIIPAFLAGLWLLSVPNFLIHSISQYADVVMAGLIAINILLLLRLACRPTTADAITWGLLLGFMVFVKDEGIICAFLMLLLVFPLLGQKKKIFSYILFPFAAILPATVIVKYWTLTAPSQGVDLHFSYLFIWDRLAWMVIYFKNVLAEGRYGGVLFIPILLVLVKLFSFWDKTTSTIVRFLLSYTMLFFFYVLFRDNFKWYFGGTCYRFIYQLLPLAMIILFYSLFNKSRDILSKQGLLCHPKQ